jgi:hypothetical protein
VHSYPCSASSTPCAHVCARACVVVRARAHAHAGNLRGRLLGEVPDDGAAVLPHRPRKETRRAAHSAVLSSSRGENVGACAGALSRSGAHLKRMCVTAPVCPLKEKAHAGPPEAAASLRLSSDLPSPFFGLAEALPPLVAFASSFSLTADEEESAFEMGFCLPPEKYQRAKAIAPKISAACSSSKINFHDFTRALSVWHYCSYSTSWRKVLLEFFTAVVYPRFKTPLTFPRDMENLCCLGCKLLTKFSKHYISNPPPRATAA